MTRKGPARIWRRGHICPIYGRGYMMGEENRLEASKVSARIRLAYLGRAYGWWAGYGEKRSRPDIYASIWAGYGWGRSTDSVAIFLFGNMIGSDKKYKTKKIRRQDLLGIRCSIIIFFRKSFVLLKFWNLEKLLLAKSARNFSFSRRAAQWRPSILWYWLDIDIDIEIEIPIPSNFSSTTDF